MDALKDFWKKLINLGAEAEMPYPLRRRIVLANQFSLIIFLVSTLFMGIFLARATFVPIPIMALIAITLGIFVLNKFGYTSVARFIVAVAPMFAILALNIFSKISAPENIESVHYVSVRLLMVACLALPLTMFTVNEKGYMYTGVGIIIAAVLGYDLIHTLFGVDNESLGISSSFRKTIYEDIFLMMVILLSAFAFLLQMNVRFNQMNLALLQEAEQRNQALNQRETELKATLQEVETSRKEDTERNWINKGISDIAALLRRKSNDQHLYDQLVSSLVQYMQANQAGMYIVEEKAGKTLIELVACYAYSRKKFVAQQFEPGQGLVGQCYLEQKTIRMNRIPANYISITSGLGEATPRFLVILPLKVNGKVEGLLEIASFREFAQYHLDFLERLSENIASFIANQRISRQTAQLLEQSNQLAEEMRAKEQEARANVEALRVAQAQMEHKEAEYQQQIRQLEQALAAQEQALRS